MTSSPFYVVSGVRTPFSRSGTALADADAVELGRAALSQLITRSDLDPALVDEAIFGCVAQPADAANIARVIALRAGLPQNTPAMTVQRNCASGLQAVTSAYEKFCAGQGSVFVAGGTESMTHTPLLFRHSAALKFAAMGRARGMGAKSKSALAFRLSDFAPLIALKLGLTDPVAELNMGETAEVLARTFHISRDAQDAFAARSHLYAAATAEAREREIVPVYTGKKEVAAVTVDNGVRLDSSCKKLAKLSPIFDTQTGTVTAGNSSQISDGAVALLLSGEDRLASLNTAPLGRVVSYAFTGCDPAQMGLGPVKAIDQALRQAQWKLEDVDVIEINEAFAAQVLAVLKCLKDKASARLAGLDEPLGEIDDSKLNAQGGSIALGHPVGATGARLMLTALHQLRARKAKRALVSLCIGGGQGGAMCLEAV